MVAGLIVITWMSVSPQLDALTAIRSPFHSYLIIVFGTATIMIVGLGVSRLLPGRPSADA